jgi:ABC-type sugar transport system ATPase subunit
MFPMTASTPHQGDSRLVPLIEVHNVTKRFGGVPSLRDISLSILPGTVHSLVGENGAGKSTLGKLISGVLSPDEGEIRVDGRVVNLRSPRDALSHGIVTIAQELAIVPGLSAAENVFLGVEPRVGGVVRRGQLRKKYLELARRLNFNVPPDAMAGSLSTAGQQQIEVMRALAREARLVIMDEPTAALSAGEVLALHSIIRSLTAEGKSVLLISHFLTEVLDLSDTITTLRDGCLVSTIPSDRADHDSLIEGMLGRSLDSAFPPKCQTRDDAPMILRVKDLVSPKVSRVSFDLREGEILGIAGLVGAGRSELARAIYQDARRQSGEVVLDGRPLASHSPTASIRRRLSMIPESRKEMGLFLGRSLQLNVSISSLGSVSRWGWISHAREKREVEKLLQLVGVKAASSSMAVGGLSGGNQQKLLFARSMMISPKVLLADEPTRGVDVGSKRAIYDLLVELAQTGVAVIVISSEIEEVLGLAHRVLVMKSGQVVKELKGEEMNQKMILESAFAGSVMNGVAK